MNKILQKSREIAMKENKKRQQDIDLLNGEEKQNYEINVLRAQIRNVKNDLELTQSGAVADKLLMLQNNLKQKEERIN